MKKILLNAIFWITVFLLSFVFKIYETEATNSFSGSGWAWGGSEEISDGNPNNGNSGYETGIGWISMNSSSCDTDDNGFIDVICGGNNTTTFITDFGVDIPFVDGSLSGYAWSENVGWISFKLEDLAGCPAGACLAERINNSLKGWARIMSIPQNSTNNGGWLGWISLNSSNCDADKNGQSDGAAGCPAAGTAIPNYGITINSDRTITKGQNTSYAWSDELGFIDFSKVNLNGCAPGAPYANYTCVADECVACGTTTDWKCFANDKCGTPTELSKTDCTTNGVPACGINCPACPPVVPPANSHKWREVNP